MTISNDTRKNAASVMSEIEEDLRWFRLNHSPIAIEVVLLVETTGSAFVFR